MNEIRKVTWLIIISLLFSGYIKSDVEIGQRWRNKTNNPFLELQNIIITDIKGDYVQYQYEKTKLLNWSCYTPQLLRNFILIEERANEREN